MSELSRQQILASVISGRGPAFLRGVDLSHLDLSGAGWLVEADLRRANLSNVNLTRASLTGANLQGANLQSAILMAANLEGANLTNARFSGVNLTGANLRAATLKGARLVGAVLVRADLERANLEGVDFEGANLQNANLTEAKLDLANFRMCNLKGARFRPEAMPRSFHLLERRLQFDALPSVGFSGSISSVRLADLMQLVCLAQANLVLSIEAGESSGIVHIRSGRICHAQVDQLEGEEAFFEILHWENGRFDSRKLPDVEIRTIDKSVEYLLVEAMRYRDEKWTKREVMNQLIEELRKHAPIPVRPAHELHLLLSKEWVDEESGPPELKITDAFDSGEAGILCSISVGDKVMIAPLWHLEIDPEHSLYNRIIEYQIEHR